MAFTGHSGFTGHGGFTGHTGHTGHAGRRLMPGGLDVYAGEDVSPLLLDALVQPASEKWVLDSLGNPAEVEPFDGNQVRQGWGGNAQLPAVTDPAQAEQRFWRLAAAPRAELCFGQLFAGLEFVQPAAAAAPLALHVRGTASLPMITLTRPGFDVFRAHLEQVHREDSKHRRARAAEILTQLTPAEAVWSSITGLNANRYRRTLELLDVALDVTVPVVYRFKQHFLCPRPFEYSPQIQPVIMTPSHDSWPSGHATEAHVTARLLALLAAHCGDSSWAAGVAARVFDSARRIAHNRQVAGVHFPTDSSVGRLLGDTIARYVAAVGDPAGQPAVKAREFDAPAFYRSGGSPALGRDLEADTDLDSGFDVAGGSFWQSPATPPAHARYFQWLWAAASAEWQQA